MLANLRVLFSGLVDIILFRRGPENLPASQALLAIVVVLNIVIAVIMSILVGQTSPNPLLLAIIGSAVMLLWFRTALAFANKRERFLQMMTAMFGTNSFFLPAAVPLSAAIQPYFEKADPTVAPPLALMLMGTVIGIWALAVEIRIVKATFECPWIGAALLVIGEFFAAITLASLLFGGAAKAAAQT